MICVSAATNYVRLFCPSVKVIKLYTNSYEDTICSVILSLYVFLCRHARLLHVTIKLYFTVVYLTGHF